MGPKKMVDFLETSQHIELGILHMVKKCFAIAVFTDPSPQPQIGSLKLELHFCSTNDFNVVQSILGIVHRSYSLAIAYDLTQRARLRMTQSARAFNILHSSM